MRASKKNNGSPLGYSRDDIAAPDEHRSPEFEQNSRWAEGVSNWERREFRKAVFPSGDHAEPSPRGCAGTKPTSQCPLDRNLMAVPLPSKSTSPRRRITRKGSCRQRRRKYNTPSEDDSDASTGADATDSEQSVQKARGVVFARTKGPKIRSLVELQPANRWFETLLNYR